MKNNAPSPQDTRAYADPLAKRQVGVREPTPMERMETKRLIFPIFLAVFLLVVVMIVILD